MENKFTGSDIVELGIEIEKNGRAFYDALAKQSKISKAKEIFKYLAGEEEKHISVFNKILGTVKKYEPAEAYPEEYFSYMNALAGEYVFTRKNTGMETAKNITSDIEAVNTGIMFEKDSIVFYEGMKKIVHEADYKIIESLIMQEQSHFKKLSDLKKSLKAVNG